MDNDKLILDACCGSRMFWFDKHNPNVLFVDKRSETVTAKGFWNVTLFILHLVGWIQKGVILNTLPLRFTEKQFIHKNKEMNQIVRKHLVVN